ncbi:MAG: hypothetical protein QOH42_1332 [Blastocatellia bacterium]|nr:hypothetical protein [Blastocatellia bacterium]MDX6305887.1 hypothetical protein [Blastocatellia bacterium]
MIGDRSLRRSEIFIDLPRPFVLVSARSDIAMSFRAELFYKKTIGAINIALLTELSKSRYA